jgi:HAD superfamily 5'-nucleotidase-like hydrolase
MLPGTSLSSVQHLLHNKSFACWCVSHLHLPPISSSTSRGSSCSASITTKNGEFLLRRLYPPPLSVQQSFGGPLGGLRVFQLKLLSCMAAGRADRGSRQDMMDISDPGVASRGVRINGVEIRKVDNSSPMDSSSPFARPDVENGQPQGWISSTDYRKQIFCNRSLNMKSIVAVGFDMDYTLAQYKPETFETMAYTGTIKKLVFNLGYPKELLDWQFDWKYMVRGLVLDKKRGNILKMDRHKYVKVAYHGFRQLSREDRAFTYGNGLSRESFDEPDYALVDTLFSLAEAYLFAQLVELKDANPEKVPADYSQMYTDVRAAVDLCHRDGTLKEAVANDPGKYINEDKKIMPMLKMLRESGRLTFLATNSLWDYTHVVMNYLFGKTGTSTGIPRDHDWLSYFDIVITGCAKPAFFKDGNRAPLFEVDIKSGMLKNTDNGSPQAQIGEMFVPAPGPISSKQSCRVFQGGGVSHLHNLLAIEASAQVMYVGDHIYGDILRSKKALGWRTMLVVPELERELELLQETADLHKEVQRLRHQRDDLEDTLNRLAWELKHAHTSDEDSRAHIELQSIQIERDLLREQHRDAQRKCHHRFHKIWGQLMKTGYQNSRFAHQVERFACLYTSQVTNLRHYSPEKVYRTTEDYMPHEMEVYSLYFQ